MANRDDGRAAREVERAAAETREPASAARARAEDDEETRTRQRDAAAGLRAAEGALEDTEERLRETGGELRGREGELEQMGELAEDVARRAKELRAGTSRTADAIRETRVPRVDPAGEGGRGNRES